MKKVATLFLVLPFGLAAAPPLKDVLYRTGKNAELFWEQFAAVNCTESVTQLKLGEGGKPVFRQESAFDYLVMLRMAEDDLTLEESRVRMRAAGNAKNVPLLVTNGFSALLLVFHPFFQGSFEFSPPADDTLDGREASRVEFRQLHNARSPSCLRLRGRDYPLEWRGAAWIDPDSGSLLRITAELQASMEDLGLRALNADVRYAPVHFSGVAEAWWLPSMAVIEAQTAKQRWRNIHRFTNFKRFSVNTSSRTESTH